MTRHGQSRLDVGLACILAAVALGVYMRTLFPGLGGGGDATKFQFVGSVLGTPHPPGYPLYILVSFLFSKIPIETLAWRINFMSAFFAAATVGIAFAAMRRTGCRRWVAASGALALGFDRYMWAKAVHAEVYTLAAALVAAIVLCAIRWHDTRRTADFYVLVGVFALSLGNHLTVTTLVPGLVVFTLLTDRRVLNVRTIAVSSLILAAGAAQYGFIWLRTVQGAPYLEARATNVNELLNIVRASRFSYQVFAFSPSELIVDRVPVLWRFCLSEFNALGIFLVLAGTAALIVRRERVGVLLVLGAGGILFLTLNVNADVDGFLVPAFVIMWMIAGIGLEALWRVIIVPGPAPALVMGAVAVALPSWQLWRNYAGNDHHGRTYEIRYFQALFDMLPGRAAIVSESYSVDHLVYYKLVGERAAAGRQIEVVPKDADLVRGYVQRGFAVFAFSEGRGFLGNRGFRLTAVNLSSSGSPQGMVDTTFLPLFRVVRVAGCRDVGNAGWQDITDIPAGDGRLIVRVDNYRPFDSKVTFYAGAAARAPAEPMLAASQGPRAPRFTLQTYDQPGAPALSAALRQDGVPAPDRLLREPRVKRIQLDVNDMGEFSWSALDLRTRPDVLLVRALVDLDNPRRATACGWSGQDLFEAADVERISVGADGNVMFGMGWHAMEHAAAGLTFRWTGAKQAEVLVPLARTGAIRVRVRALPFDFPGSPPHALSLVLNGVPFDARPMSADWDNYEWSIPAIAWLTGFNRLQIGSSTLASPSAVQRSTDTRQLGIAVSELTLTMEKNP